MPSFWKNNVFKAVLALSLFAAPAYADPFLTAGNVSIRSKTLEKIMRDTIATQIGAQITRNTLSLQTPATQETVTLPQTTGMLKSILDNLGITNSFPLKISPIKAGFYLPPSALKFSIRNRSANQFTIAVRVSLNSLSATADSLSIQIPEAIFGQAATVSSNPVQISLAKGSPAVQMEIDLLATLGNNGAKFKLLGFNSNLNSANPPQLAFTLGPLTINNAPLTLRIAQDGENGQALDADEPTIRAELQKLESTYIDTIREKISTALHAQIMGLAKNIQGQGPLKYSFKSDELVASASKLTDKEKSPLEGIEFSGIASYLQTEQNSALCSTQISASVCFDGLCVQNTQVASALADIDYSFIQKTDDAGVILDESFIKDFTNSSAFQQRIAKLYQAAGTTPGVELATSGVKAFLDPETNSVVAILNLEIDIRKTVANGWFASIKRDIGDWIETEFGSGKFVKIPVAINIKIAGLQKDAQGATNLVLDFTLPSFPTDTTFLASPLCSVSDCPNNVPNMTSAVRGTFLGQVKGQVQKVISNEMKIPLNTTQFAGLGFQIHNVMITPNHGLLITAGMSELPKAGIKP